MKDLGPLSYFLGLEVSLSSDDYYLTQAKYTSDLISRVGITNNKIVDTPIEYNNRLNTYDGEPLPDATLYKQLVRSLVYLTVTRPDISYAVDTPIEYNNRLNTHDGEPLPNATLYKQLAGSLVYLTVTRLDISYVVHIVSQFMDAPRSLHYAAVI